MRKVIIAITLLLVIGVTYNMAQAQTLSIGDELKKIPALKQGVAFSLIDNDFSYLTTIELANFKGFSAEAGYSSKNKAVGVVSYKIAKLADYGVDLPILKLVEFNLGVFAGYGDILIGTDSDMKGNNAFDAGLSLTLIQVKF